MVKAAHSGHGISITDVALPGRNKYSGPYRIWGRLGFIRLYGTFICWCS